MKVNMTMDELKALLSQAADKTLNSAKDKEPLDISDDTEGNYADDGDLFEDDLDCFNEDEENKLYNDYFGSEVSEPEVSTCTVNTEQTARPTTGTVITEQTARPTTGTVNIEQTARPTTESVPTSANNGKIIKFPFVRENLGKQDFFKKSPDDKFESVDKAVQQMVNDTVADDVFLNECTEAVLECFKPYMSKNVRKARSDSYNSSSSDKHWKSRTMYKQDVLDIGGRDVKINRVKETPRWTLDLQDCVTNDDKARNFDQVRTKITEEIVNYFGGFNRIQKIYVSSLQLVINDVIYTPVLSDAILARLPFDSADYVKNGYLAPLFDWGYLSKMNNLSVLSIDDFDFAMQTVGADLGKGRDFKPMSLFNVCKNLSYLELGGEVITYPLNTEDEKTAEAIKNVEEEAHRYGRFDAMYTQCYEKVGNTLGGVRGWTVNNLTTFANNRGNKGIFKYTLGLVGRTVVAGTAGAVELGVKSAGYLLRGIGRTLKDAMTPVNVEDMKK